MSKRRDLKSRLKNDKLLPTMTGGAVTINANFDDLLTYKKSGVVKTISVTSLVNGADGVPYIKAILGSTDTAGNQPAGGPNVDPTGKSAYNYLHDYTTVANPVSYNPAIGTNNGIPAWVIDQLNAHAMNYTNTPVSIPLGASFTTVVGGPTFTNRLLTLYDLVGIKNGNVLSMASDVQAVLESSPIAQFKHLPAIDHLKM